MSYLFFTGLLCSLLCNISAWGQTVNDPNLETNITEQVKNFFLIYSDLLNWSVKGKEQIADKIDALSAGTAMQACFKVKTLKNIPSTKLLLKKQQACISGKKKACDKLEELKAQRMANVALRNLKSLLWPKVA